MPFVPQEHRDHPDYSIPGDRCFVEYRAMVDAWKASPRWTTFDKMVERLFPNPENRALFLATLVFYERYISDYEKKKEAENGLIE